jgi:EAL and modified HD-GYP domain-containing signal transduction protein
MAVLDRRALAAAHVGRQPIFDVHGALTAYELLFRDSPDAAAAVGSGDDATTTTILAAFTEFDADALLAGRPGFINLTRSFLTGRLPVPFSPQTAVLEVLETVEVDDEVLRGIRALAERGFRVALDDFVWTTATDPLLDVAAIVKIDVLGQSWDQVSALADRCRSAGIQLLAERIETEEMLERCRETGFELFQGYHLGRPTTVSTATLTPNHANALLLLARLADPATTARDVEELVRADPALTYRLLRIANSSANGLRRRVSSVRDAVVIVGLAPLRSWLALLTLTDGAAATVALTATLVRARSCELLVQKTGAGPPDVAFTIGLLDGLAEAFGMAGSAFTELLPPLAPEIVAALQGHGPVAAVLESVREYERVAEGRGAGEVSQAYLSALGWAGQMSRLVDEAGRGS